MGLQDCWKVATGRVLSVPGDKAHNDSEFDVRHELNWLTSLLRYDNPFVNGLGNYCTATEFY